jgi:hypothetical protein
VNRKNKIKGKNEMRLINPDIFYSISVYAFFVSQEGDLKKPLKIKYVGGGEQGLDMGGLQREFFHMIVDSIFESGTLM